MIFEFIIVHESATPAFIIGLLRDGLREALEANLNDVEDNELEAMVTITFQRPQPLNGSPARRILGFRLDLPDDTSAVREVVDEFTAALNAEPIVHVLKCEDPLLHNELVLRSKEIFAVEMKLRRVLSIIYLHAYPETDPYDLLSEEGVQPMASAKPQREQMLKVAENQFFHLTFGQYVGLNQRPAIKDLVALIRNKVTYDDFRSELLRQPVEHEDDAGFLAGLKERMDAIEKMRNAVAHNRRPSKKMTNNYLAALPLVDHALDDYLSALEVDYAEAHHAVSSNEPFSTTILFAGQEEDATVEVVDSEDRDMERDLTWEVTLDEDETVALRIGEYPEGSFTELERHANCMTLYGEIVAQIQSRRIS